MKRFGLKSLLVTVVIIWVSTLFVDYCGLFTPLEDTFTNVRYRKRATINPPPTKILERELLMVTLDEKTLELINYVPGQPVPREVHARVIEALARGGARLILVDTYFPDPSSDPQADARLVQAVEEAGNVIIGTRFEAEQELDPMTMELIDLHTVAPPFPELNDAAAATGVLNLDTRYANPDQIIRNVLYTLRVQDTVYPSLSAAAASALGAVNLKEDGTFVFGDDGSPLSTTDWVWTEKGVLGKTVILDYAKSFDDEGHVERYEGFHFVSYSKCLSDSWWYEGLSYLQKKQLDNARKALQQAIIFSENPDDEAGLLVRLIDSMGENLLKHLVIKEMVPDAFHTELKKLSEGTIPPRPVEIGKRISKAGSEVSGAVCLLAPWAEALGDQVLTPFGRLRGACLHADLLLSLTSGRQIIQLKTTPLWFIEPAVLLMFLCLIAWFVSWSDLGKASILAVLVPIGFVYASFAMFARWGILYNTSPTVAALGLLIFKGVVARFAMEQRERWRVKKLFSRYVAPDVVAEILRNSDMLKMDGKTVDASVLFLDICGFTSFSEKHQPEEVFKKLNTYFDIIVDAILTSGGTLDKFIGEAVMAVFGAPVPMEDHPVRAVKCALEIRDRLENYNNNLAAGDPPFRIRIGVNCGRCIAGNVGTQTRSEYTVIGDTVNLASRLESSAAPGEIIISEEIFWRQEKMFLTEEREPIKLKGKSRPHKTFKVIGLHT